MSSISPAAKSAPMHREWTARDVCALRRFLRLTQSEFAARLGMRQQTISEWEVGKHRPRGASVFMLEHVAAESGYSAAAMAVPHLSETRHR